MCKTCCKSFTEVGNLNRHINRVHNGVKNYTCDECGSSFFEYKQLVHHKIIHTGMKPNVCKYCGKGFADFSNMRMHERTTHEGYKRPNRTGSDGK